MVLASANSEKIALLKPLPSGFLGQKYFCPCSKKTVRGFSALPLKKEFPPLPHQAKLKQWQWLNISLLIIVFMPHKPGRPRHYSDRAIGKPGRGFSRRHENPHWPHLMDYFATLLSASYSPPTKKP